MPNSGRIVGLNALSQMLRVRWGKGSSVILDASLKADKRKGGWYVVSSFTSNLLLSLSVGVSSLLVLSAFFWSAPLSKNLFFISFFSSDWIRLGFLCFLPQRSRIGRKITFNYFSFLTNFIDISLCIILWAETPFLHFEESLSTDNIQWMLS